MTWNQIKGDWNQLSRRLMERWVRLTKEDLVAVAGQRGQLLAVLQLRYGYEGDRAERELNKFVDGLTG